MYLNTETYTKNGYRITVGVLVWIWYLGNIFFEQRTEVMFYYCILKCRDIYIMFIKILLKHAFSLWMRRFSLNVAALFQNLLVETKTLLKLICIFWALPTRVVYRTFRVIKDKFNVCVFLRCLCMYIACNFCNMTTCSLSAVLVLPLICSCRLWRNCARGKASFLQIFIFTVN